MGKWAHAVVAGVAAVVVVFPGLYVAGEVVRGLVGGKAGAVPVRLGAGVLVNTGLIALLIGVLATVLALPAAWASRRLPGRAFLLFMVPMLMPSYLAYVGWGLLRAPGTRLGDFLLRGPPGAGAGENWYPVVAAKVFAVGGLVLWVWPLAALVLSGAARRIDEAVLDGLRMEARGVARAGAIAGMMRGAIGAAVGAVVLVMLGSVVPLHVSQFETYAVQIWRALDEVGPGERWRVWAAAWPLVVVAVGAGMFVGRRTGGGESGEIGRARIGWAAALGMVVWGLSVVVPIGLLIANLRGWRSVGRFWRVASDSFWWSAGIAVLVGVVGVVLAACVWVGVSGGRRAGREGGRDRAPSAAEDRGTSPGGGGWGFGVPTTLLLIAGLMPGVLVGSATARAWMGWESWLLVVVGHVARFGFVGMLAGWFLARMEGRELRDLRMMDSGGSVRGWVEAALPPQLGVLLGAGVVSGLLSFHEIEATVMLQPPTGAGGGFAWKVLQALHFNKEEDLIPAMLIVMGVGLGLALLSVLLFGIRPRGAGGASQ